ncbi:UbiA prenyltransferase [Rubrobacter xylanophilus DSM 9941]|uniref:UbiA prenyltransferase n=1 Tax=Rubrobacter xylanophilus (strain DSM 9941 / JCM 11954 / NBRC 16129 / PRD-1) TaxID=266117 RepID=Q1ATY0_RUBXD|nr:UbiA prenyltransferase [Rubrobacter xylanophilus DSM 9941]
MCAVLSRLLHISRPVLWINTVGSGFVGMWLAGHLWSWGFLPLALWLTLPFNLLIYGTNDIFDQETDAANPRKGSLEGARISPGEVRTIWRAVLLSNAPFAAYFALALPPAAALWVAAYALVFLGYSVPPVRFKARPYLDSLSNAAYAFPLVFVPLALGESPVWPAALGLMAWSVAKHAFDAVQDIREDRRAGILTTPVRLGVRGTVLWSGAWWALATLLFAAVSPPVALLNAAIAASLLLALWRRPHPGTGHRLYRYSIAFPYVAGTASGVLLVAALSLGAYP